MLSDPIADMLARIKNAYQARHKTVAVPYSKIKEKIGEILVKEGYLSKSKGQGPKVKVKKLIYKLKYPDGKPAMSGFKRISKPGVRIYQKSKKILPAPSLGITLVSTPKGVMTSRLARKKKLGGEIICQVW